MQKVSFLLIGFALALPGAVFSLPSQARKVGESYRDALKNYKRSAAPDISRIAGAISANDAAVSYDKIDLSGIPEWKPITALVDGFRKSRDFRFIADPSHPNFLRRSTWLYPDDGCFARSALMVQNLARFSGTRLKKVFIFGDLSLKTPNSFWGYVSWWYHVAPIVLSGQNVYVFDPGIDASAPILLKEWVLRMTRNIGSITLAVCSSYAYEPGSSCNIDDATADAKAFEQQLTYLDLEWARLEQLNRRPEKELGDSPPWKEADVPWTPLELNAP